MIDIKEINEEIYKLENCDCTTYDICRKLAILYIVKDHFSKNNTITPMNKTATPTMPTMPI